MYLTPFCCFGGIRDGSVEDGEAMEACCCHSVVSRKDPMMIFYVLYTPCNVICTPRNSAPRLTESSAVMSELKRGFNCPLPEKNMFKHMKTSAWHIQVRPGLLGIL